MERESFVKTKAKPKSVLLQKRQEFPFICKCPTFLVTSQVFDKDREQMRQPFRLLKRALGSCKHNIIANTQLSKRRQVVARLFKRERKSVCVFVCVRVCMRMANEGSLNDVDQGCNCTHRVYRGHETQVPPPPNPSNTSQNDFHSDL